MQELRLLFELFHVPLHSWDFLFSPTVARCPDCVCAKCPVLTQDKIPEAVTTALKFAQDQCLRSVPQTGNTSQWSFSLFWAGLLAGFFLASCFWALCILVAKCFRGSVQQQVQQQPTELPRAILPSPPVALQPQLGSGQGLSDG